VRFRIGSTQHGAGEREKAGGQHKRSARPGRPKVAALLHCCSGERLRSIWQPEWPEFARHTVSHTLQGARTGDAVVGRTRDAKAQRREARGGDSLLRRGLFASHDVDEGSSVRVLGKELWIPRQAL
jgi:hypothetical protein